MATQPKRIPSVSFSTSRCTFCIPIESLDGEKNTSELLQKDHSLNEGCYVYKQTKLGKARNFTHNLLPSQRHEGSLSLVTASSRSSFDQSISIVVVSIPVRWQKKKKSFDWLTAPPLCKKENVKCTSTLRFSACVNGNLVSETTGRVSLLNFDSDKQHITEDLDRGLSRAHWHR